MASMHGAKVDTSRKGKENDQSFKFGDPNKYENLTMEEKERLTQEMMSKHKALNFVPSIGVE